MLRPLQRPTLTSPCSCWNLWPTGWRSRRSTRIHGSKARSSMHHRVPPPPSPAAFGQDQTRCPFADRWPSQSPSSGTRSATLSGYPTAAGPRPPSPPPQTAVQATFRSGHQSRIHYVLAPCLLTTTTPLERVPPSCRCRCSPLDSLRGGHTRRQSR